MGSFEIGLLSVVMILVLIYAGMYVPVVLTLVSFLGVWLIRDNINIAISLLTLAASETLRSYILGVIPLFVLMGLFVSVSDIGKDTFAVANQLFRRVQGGLGIATVAANAVFAAITGVSVASAAVFTRVAVPEMLRFGYNPRFAVGVVAGSSVLGMLIPPSLLLIVFAILTEQSVGDMFVAGFLPGVVLAVAFSVGILAVGRFYPRFVRAADSAAHANAEAPPLMSVGEILAKLVPIAVLFLLVIGGIYGGIFTAVESGAVGALGALLLALAKRRLTWARLWQVLVETGHITASIIFLVMSASMYSQMLGVSGIPTQLGHWVQSADFAAVTIIALYITVIIVMGTLMDSISIMLIVVPLFLPLFKAFDVNLVWLGIVTVIAVEIGLLTPPVGMSVFVIKSTLKDSPITLGDIFAGAFPFAVIMLAVLVLTIAFPWLSLAFL
jgi:tripartite ATP-independent transporter DctM subunit